MALHTKHRLHDRRCDLHSALSRDSGGNKKGIHLPAAWLLPPRAGHWSCLPTVSPLQFFTTNSGAGIKVGESALLPFASQTNTIHPDHAYGYWWANRRKHASVPNSKGQSSHLAMGRNIRQRVSLHARLQASICAGEAMRRSIVKTSPKAID